ncbi:MAG TPA: delta-60 repeat domain-containing protein, partial [Polyangiaceae bacterium]|nr:delta-60 repeat domain-containing protein [Polyangiaceae bacterium]
MVLGPEGSINLLASSPQSGTTLVRLLADGSADAAFGEGGLVTLPSDDLEGYTLTAQPDGKLVVGGNHEINDYNQEAAFARLGLDGKLDSSFGEGGVASFPFGGGSLSVRNVFAVGDRVLALGAYGGDAVALRLRPDGALDTDFHAPDGLAVYDPDLVPETFGQRGLLRGGYARPDGTFYGCGFVRYPGGYEVHPDSLVLRYQPDGQPDLAFGDGGAKRIVYGIDDCTGQPRQSQCETIAEAPDAKVVMAGVSATGGRLFVARLLPDGGLDPSFGQAGFFAQPTAAVQATDVLVFADGSLLVGALALQSAATPYLVRITAQGTLDLTFGEGGVYALGPETV